MACHDKIAAEIHPVLTSRINDLIDDREESGTPD
jgi:hypothetical protein